MRAVRSSRGTGSTISGGAGDRASRCENCPEMPRPLWIALVALAELDLELTLPGHEPEELDAEVLIVRDERKLRWQDRLVLPGVRDWEYEFVIQPLEPGRVVVVQLLRSDGLLAPFTDEEAAREAL